MRFVEKAPPQDAAVEEDKENEQEEEDEEEDESEEEEDEASCADTPGSPTDPLAALTCTHLLVRS